MDLRRKSEKIISKWYEDGDKKALLVTGARQVGKTHAIRSVMKAEGANLFEINLIETPAAVRVLENANTVEDLVIGFSTLSEQKIEKGKTVIFIDEVQKYKDMITKIKFFVEEGSFRYVLSGSLLGVELTNLSSAPVGYMMTVEMFPLDFEEFLQITNISETVLASLRDSFVNRTPVMDAVNQKMLDLFIRYLVVGGMPEAVSRFADTGNVNDVMQIHRDIQALYKLDFTQYEAADKRLILTNAYELIPSELLKQNRRYVVSDLKNGLHFERVQNTFLWLKNAGVALTVFNSTEPRIPLKLNEKSSLFKLYFSDVGMLTSEYGMSTKTMLLTKNQSLNAGGIYENVVAQELRSKGYKLYYYNSNRLGELDFVIEHKNKVLPLEIKSGKDYTIHSAMNNCLSNPEYQMDEGIVFANCNVSKKGKVTYLPIYMIMFLKQDEGQVILDKIEF
ncbi:MAG: ATP-binding protein [Treponema sp.]|nr:ATP-binding protein [Treponema sp.]MBR4386930.1 ATP-binding protein [Treponema sp.]